MSSIRKTYDFKSVGETSNSSNSRRRRGSQKQAQQPIGIKVPLQLSSGAGEFLQMSYNYEEAVANNFRNMIMTNHGERLGLYDFGANLKELAFELGTEEMDTEAIRRIRQTTNKYMPYIDLLTFEPLVERFDNEHVAKVGVTITYKVSSISTNIRKIEVIIYTAG